MDSEFLLSITLLCGISEPLPLPYIPFYFPFLLKHNEASLFYHLIKWKLCWVLLNKSMTPTRALIDS